MDPSAQEEIAVICLTYLSFDTFRSGSCADDEAFGQRVTENIFLDYSAHYWSEHVRPVQSMTSQLALAFLGDEVLVDCTAQGAGYSRSFPNRTTGLHLTARYGLLYLTERILMGKHGDTNVRADSEDGYGRTPLSWAAVGGHEAVVKLLVERDDVEADSRDNYSWTPLSLAAVGGHEAVVKLLVERDDVEADSRDNDGRTPLSRAAVGCLGCGGKDAVFCRLFTDTSTLVVIFVSSRLKAQARGSNLKDFCAFPFNNSHLVPKPPQVYVKPTKFTTRYHSTSKTAKCPHRRNFRPNPW
jgi:hypothetical protein